MEFVTCFEMLGTTTNSKPNTERVIRSKASSKNCHPAKNNKAWALRDKCFCKNGIF